MRFSIGRVALAAAALAMLAAPGLAQDEPKAPKPKAKPEVAFPAGKTIEMATLFGAASASTHDGPRAGRRSWRRCSARRW